MLVINSKPRLKMSGMINTLKKILVWIEASRCLYQNINKKDL